MSTQTPENPARWKDPERLDGIPLLSTFMAADEDAAIFRKFTRLGTRNLLHQQNRLNELEETLDQLDKEDVKEGPMNPMLRAGARAYDSIRSLASIYETWLHGAGGNVNGITYPNDMLFPKRCYERVKLHEEIALALHQYRTNARTPSAISTS